MTLQNTGTSLETRLPATWSTMILTVAAIAYHCQHVCGHRACSRRLSLCIPTIKRRRSLWLCIGYVGIGMWRGVESLGVFSPAEPASLRYALGFEAAQLEWVHPMGHRATC